MRFDTSMDSLNVPRSESVTDLNSELNGLPRRASVSHLRNDENFLNTTPPKPFGIGKLHSLLIFLLSVEKIIIEKKEYLITVTKI